MSYAIRNTIVLASVLAVIWIGGYLTLYLMYDRPAQEYEEENEELAAELEQYEQQIEDYELVVEQHEQALDELDGFPKQYVQYEEIDRIYDLIRRYNVGSTYTEFDFTLEGGHLEEEETEAQINIEGEGEFNRLAAFVETIENEPALALISEMSVEPVSEADTEDARVRFDIQMDVHLTEESVGREDLLTRSVQTYSWGGHNPFTPLVYDPAPNERGLPDIRGGSIAAMGSERIWVSKADGEIISLRQGDEVYLGRLLEIDQDAQEARFRLNVGGILQHETLEFEPE